MNNCALIYRIYDDQEEKHYLSSVLDHKKLEEIVEEYKLNNEKVYAKEFIIRAIFYWCRNSVELISYIGQAARCRERSDRNHAA